MYFIVFLNYNLFSILVSGIVGQFLENPSENNPNRNDIDIFNNFY